MPKRSEYDGEVQLHECTAVREGSWYFAYVRGQLVAKRYTRDEAFDVAAFCFPSGRSPRYPRTMGEVGMFRLRVDFLVSTVKWKRAYGSGQLANMLMVPIEGPGRDPVPGFPREPRDSFF